MRKTLIILAVVMSIASAAMAVGPFDDVPRGHWAYQAMKQLEKRGIVKGYPEGTTTCKPLMTRYEFAVSIARILHVIGLSAVLQDGLHAVDNEPIVNPTNEDIRLVHKLADEFRDELSALGVDIDALRREFARIEGKKVLTTNEVHTLRIISSPQPLNTPLPFSDVPKNHWAYDAVNQLRKDGVLIGSARDTFDGSRPITRNEFAAAIARLIPVIKAMSLAETRSQIDELDQRISAIDGQKTPNTSDLATREDLSKVGSKADKADVDALNRLINEFSNELKRMRVDVDALKRDVASLNKRVNKADKEKWF